MGKHFETGAIYTCTVLSAGRVVEENMLKQGEYFDSLGLFQREILTPSQ